MPAKKMEVENLTVRFGDFLAVKNLSFEVNEGGIVGFLGPNGAGKTTTIKAIFGVIPYEGRILIHGKKDLIGWMPQNSPLYLNLTVEENLKFFASIYGMRRRIEERVEELLSLVELSDYRKRLVKNLSGGMKQRLIHLKVKEKEKSFNLLRAKGYRVELNEEIRILVNDSGESLPEILDILRENNIKVLRSETSVASLEEAFMRIIEE
ncbi:MAG TPA: ABC transporter ATP-binding protein [Archaeoglobaceae archaeon]|nr:ABC transporter ATP-binding protein [Archaeoglobaceae archaeon]